MLMIISKIVHTNLLNSNPRIEPQLCLFSTLNKFAAFITFQNSFSHYLSNMHGLPSKTNWLTIFWLAWLEYDIWLIKTFKKPLFFWKRTNFVRYFPDSISQKSMVRIFIILASYIFSKKTFLNMQQLWFKL